MPSSLNLKLLLLTLSFSCYPLYAKKDPCVGSLAATPKEEANFYIYLQEGNLDRIIRGEFPWSNDDDFQKMIGRAREHIASMKGLSQKQNIQLWEAYVERISHYTSGYMKNHKAVQSDGTVIFYSDSGRFLNQNRIDFFYYYFAFPPDASMFYAKRNASTLPNEPNFEWRNGNDSLVQLK